MAAGYIQSQDRFNECVIVGPAEDNLRLATKTTNKSDLDQLPLIGFCGNTGGHRAFLYRWQGELRIRVDDGLPIPVTDDLSVLWVRSGNQVRFALMQNGNAIIDFHYLQSEDLSNIKDDPTPFVEAEDFDFFLLIRNVLTDPGRKDRMFR
jgi:hypothetical protein